MSLVRLIARPLIAAPFIARGLDMFLHPMNPAEHAAGASSRLSASTPLPDNPELLVRAGGLAMIGAGALLASGTMPRTAAATLALTALPITAIDAAAERDARLAEEDVAPVAPAAPHGSARSSLVSTARNVTTGARHFITDPKVHRVARSVLLRDLGLFGAVLLAAADTAGRPGLAWRTRRAADQLEGHISQSADQLGRSAEQVSDRLRAAVPGRS